jgi:hypothetical protein
MPSGHIGIPRWACVARSMLKATETADRLTIEDGRNLKAAALGCLTMIVIAGAGLIGCIRLFYYSELLMYHRFLDANFSESELGGKPTFPWVTTVAGLTVLLLLTMAALGRGRNQMVFDRALGTMRLLRIRLSPLETSVCREEPLASIRGAKLTGSRGSFWQLVIEFNSGEMWEPPLPAMQTEQYQPDELQKIADQMNQFLGVSRDSREG